MLLLAHKIKLQVSLPIAGSVRMAAPAKVLEHGGRMLTKQPGLLRRIVPAPPGAVGRKHPKPEPQRRVMYPVERLLGGPCALGKGEFPFQDRGVQQLLEQP